jgi:hypothetical protein
MIVSPPLRAPWRGEGREVVSTDGFVMDVAMKVSGSGGMCSGRD